jgi:hypothetical protein
MRFSTMSEEPRKNASRRRAATRAIGPRTLGPAWAVNAIVKFAKSPKSESVRLRAVRSMRSDMIAAAEIAFVERRKNESKGSSVSAAAMRMTLSSDRPYVDQACQIARREETQFLSQKCHGVQRPRILRTRQNARNRGLPLALRRVTFAKGGRRQKIGFCPRNFSGQMNASADVRFFDCAVNRATGQACRPRNRGGRAQAQCPGRTEFTNESVVAESFPSAFGPQLVRAFCETWNQSRLPLHYK